MSSWARLCLTAARALGRAGVAGASGRAARRPTAAVRHRPARRRIRRSRGRRRGMTSNDTLARSSCGSGSATAESTATSTVRRRARGHVGDRDRDRERRRLGRHQLRALADEVTARRRARPALPSAGTPRRGALGQRRRQAQRAAARRPGVGDLDGDRRRRAADDLGRGRRGHGLVRRRGRRRDAEDLDLHRGRGLRALVVGDRDRDHVLALARACPRRARERRAACRARRRGPSSTRSRSSPSSWSRSPAIGLEQDRLQARRGRVVRTRRGDLDRRRGVGHADGDAGELRDRAAQAVRGRDREAARAPCRPASRG